MDNREAELGFKPQKETIYNKLLPYNDSIDSESNAVFAEIKGNLGRAVQLRDLKVGAAHWVGQLTRYIRLYGMKFSKEDHVALIHLLYELTVIPELEVSLVQKFSSQLVHLLKKKTLLSRDDLTLAWRPLYDLVEAVQYSRYEQYGLHLLPANIESSLKRLIHSCRPYFSVGSTQEMLDEWRPLLCPFDITVMKGLGYLDYFLPTNLEGADIDRGFKLWFTELIDMWDSFQIHPSWENSIVSLMSRLAHDNIGYIDWEPFIPKVFTRLLRSFRLPVGSPMAQVGRLENGYDIQAIVQWIVSMMGGGSSALEHVHKLFKSLETFYHPSNLGKWNIRLSELLMTFPKVFIKRVHRERFQKPRWWRGVPESHRLTDADITQFVESLKPIVFTNMFSKYGSQDSAIAFRHLSTMRPEIIVPPLLEKLYPAMETLIEPHRLIACMNCVVSVCRSMLNAGRWYKEGPSHIIPLLNLSLPGIDPNDFKKCLITFQMISTFVALVPIVDCSEAIHTRTDLTEEERELCSATAQFEDFVLQFIDRTLGLIENSAQEHMHGDAARLNPEQAMLEVGLASTFTSVLQQCSTPIYTSALRRLHTFITSSIYETRVGGRFAGNLVRAAAKVYPEAALKTFVPTFCDNILHHIRNHEDVLTEEQLDDSFLWNIQMLTQVVRCDGSKLLPYKDQLLEVLTHIVQLKCVHGYELAGQLLRFLLRALTLIFPLDYRSVNGSLDRPPSEYLVIRDWGKSGDVEHVDIKWHIPSQDEVQFASDILDTLLQPELLALKQISPDNVMQREELLRRLNNVLECLSGAGAVLPMWEGETLQMIECRVPMSRFGCNIDMGTKLDVKLKGGNVRVAVAETITSLLGHMMSHCEDDTKGLFRLIRIYETVLFFHGSPKTDFDGRWKSFHIVKNAIEDRMRGGKRHIRALLVDRIQLQHELRSLSKTDRAFTERHKALQEDLFTLSISRYSEVRKKAQAVLFQNFQHYPYSYRALLQQMVEKVKTKDIPEHEFKGALYIINGNNRRNVLTKRSWEVTTCVWPAVIQAQHSEKPSILKVIDAIITKTVKNVETTAIKTETNASTLAAAEKILVHREPLPSLDPASPQLLQDGVQYETAKNEKNQKMYEDLVHNIVDLIKHGNLTWKFCHIGLELLGLLIRHDTPTPVAAIDLNVQRSVHDSLIMRKLALSSLGGIQKQQKRAHRKVNIDPYKVAGVDPPAAGSEFHPGVRPDNQWHVYNSADLPDTQDKWESLVVVEKTHWGYYTWPSSLTTYAPHSEQPKVTRGREELSEGERVVYDAFTSQEYVDKLVKFLSMEEHKGKDKYNSKTMTLFKGLFRNYGTSFLEKVKPHVERLVSDQSHDKHDSSQRCAMEILSGLLRGSKHWEYTETVALWEWAVPLLRSALSNLTVSTIADWASFFTHISESRDPRKIYWLFEMLLDNPLSDEASSFGDAGRLYMAQSALLQQEWRVGDIQLRLMKYLTPHLAHPYKNVRDRIGVVLSNMFVLDYTMYTTSQTVVPWRARLLEEVRPQLDRLQEIAIEEAQHQNGGSGRSSPMVNADVEAMNIDNHTEENEERKSLTRLCKTVMSSISNSITRTFNPSPAEIFPLIPLMCTLVSETKDEELKLNCFVTLTCLSQSLLHPDVIPVALHTIKTTMGLQSWHARSAALAYLQKIVFSNFFTFHRPDHQASVREIVLHLICDDHLEVRQVASETLSGLLHCGYMDMDTDMLEHFERLSRVKLNRKKMETMSMDKVIQRHAGILGLCAYVQAYPYTVPQFMPQILMDLSNHVNDPQPIQATVKKSLSNFKRTHHDNWHDHKLMFTDDQLGILTDLLVSPNYYA